MEYREFIIETMDRVTDTMEKAMRGLSPEELNRQPNPESNSIGWLAWHLSRVQDRAIANLLKRKQVYIVEKWYEKFGRAADPEDTGRLHTIEDLAAFKAPDAQTLLGYYRDVFELTKSYIADLTRQELSRGIEHPRFPTAGVWLEATISDSLQHAGQIAYVRGLLFGSGWADA